MMTPHIRVTTPLSKVQPQCGKRTTRAAAARNAPATMHSVARKTVRDKAAPAGASVTARPATTYRIPTRSCTSSPLHRPAQNEATIVATPEIIRVTPSTATATNDVKAVTAGKTSAALPQTASRIPKSKNHHQLDRKCRNSWRNECNSEFMVPYSEVVSENSFPRRREAWEQRILVTVQFS